MKQSSWLRVLAGASLCWVTACGGNGDGRNSDGGGDGLTSLGGTGQGDAGETDDAGDADGSGGDGLNTKFDVAPPKGDENCGDGNGNGGGAGPSLDFSYIWIANTGDSPPTVSKINTQTLIEEGRYQTRDDGGGNPSRTSVALSGHSAVANRAGGVTKFFAYDCPAGPTSVAQGAGLEATLQPWDMESCRAWSTNMSYSTQRPIAWTPGTFNEDTCTWENELVWTAGANGGGNTVEVIRLDGETGAILDVIPIPELTAGTFGAYGGASDGDGNFWFTQLGSDGRDLVRVNTDTTYSIHTHGIDSYGMQVDAKGRPWVCGRDGSGTVARFDPVMATFDVVATGERMYGCMPDDQFLWVGGNSASVRGIHLETMTVDRQWPLTGADNTDVHGTSIDFDGYVWGVTRGTMAFKVHPDTGTLDNVVILNSPYTYSDMTGFGLANAGSPEG